MNNLHVNVIPSVVEGSNSIGLFEYPSTSIGMKIFFKVV